MKLLSRGRVISLIMAVVLTAVMWYLITYIFASFKGIVWTVYLLALVLILMLPFVYDSQKHKGSDDVRGE